MDEFQESVRGFHEARADGDYGELVRHVALMRAQLRADSASDSETSVMREMLGACESCARETVLGALRAACLSAVFPTSDTSEEAFARRATEYEALYGHCVALELDESVAAALCNALSGALDRSLDEATNELVSLRAVSASFRRGARGGTAAAVNDGVAQPHAAALSRLLGNGSRALIGWQRVSASSAPPSVIMTTMHEACTARAVEVMQWFLGDHRMLRDDTAALADMPPPPPRAPPDGADGAADASPMLALDKLLDELALVCQIAHRYCRFASDVLAVNMHHQPTTSTAPSIIALLSQIEGAYIRLEDMYCMDNVRHALAIAEPLETQHSSGVIISSAVTDCFFLLRKCAERAITTLSAQAVVAEFHRTVEMLQPHAPLPSCYDAVCALATTPLKPRDSAASGAPARGSETQLSATELLLQAVDDDVVGSSVETLTVAMNSADESASSVRELMTSLRDQLPDASPTVSALLDELAPIASAYDALRDEQAQQLRDSHLANAFEDFGAFAESCDFRLNSATHESTRAAGADSAPLTERARALLLEGATLRLCARSMTPGALAALQQSVSSRLVEILTEEMQRWRFTDWGALLLQKDVRLLQTRLSDLAPGHSVRPQFAALSQRVALLNLERPMDVLDTPLARAVLTDGQVRETLSLRVDFEADAIEALRLS